MMARLPLLVALCLAPATFGGAADDRRGGPLFDPATIRDRATFEKPHQYAEGVSVLVVNGEVALAGDRMTGARPGRVLRARVRPPAVTY